MARLFLNNHWFHKVLPETLSEGEFEQKMTLQAPNLYPDYYVIPFKKTVSSPDGNAKADLAFIAKDYKDWYVVEVEMAYHDFDSHVEPQINRLLNAKYDDGVIEYFCHANPGLDRAQTSKLIRNEPVKILLILNEAKNDWAKDLKNKYGAITSVFEIFHFAIREKNIVLPPEIYGISGSYPVYSVSVTTKCTVHPCLPYLGIEDNSVLSFKHDDQVALEYKNCITFWKVTQGPPDNSIWLKLLGRSELLDKKKKYRITKLRDDSLLLDII